MSPASILPFHAPRVVPAPSSQGCRHIVQVSHDAELSRLRARVLATAGYSVKCLSPGGVEEELRRSSTPSVWMFCHTLEFYESVLSAIAVRRCRPADKTLRLSGIGHSAKANGPFDQLLGASETIDTMLQVVTSLARQLAE